MDRAGSGQPAGPITLAGTPATVVSRWYFLQNDAAGSDAAAITDLDIP